jgi:uroporphyrinogen decarboxylase
LDEWLLREQGITAQEYVDSFVDIVQVTPDYIGPLLAPGEDEWGVVRVPVSYGSGSYDEIETYPLAHVQEVGDLDGHPWPTTELFDYASFPQKLAAVQAERERCLMVANGNIFESAWYMRGFERIFMDMALNPELVHAIHERVTDFYVSHFRAMLAAADGAVDLAFTADDIAGQNGPLLSPAMWEEFIKPYHMRLNRTIHEFGVRVIYHTDGAVMGQVEGLIDMGIDVLQALQFSAAGMDPFLLKQRAGDRLSFEGGVCVQQTLPWASVEAVRAETMQLIDALGPGGGYILGPSHAIQAGTPPENIVAMFETAASYYPF